MVKFIEELTTRFPMTRTPDFFTRFINWLSESGADRAPITSNSSSRDFFSRLMNRVSG